MIKNKFGLIIGIIFIGLSSLSANETAKSLLYFNFDEGKSNIVTNKSCNNNNGELIGDVEWVKKKNGYAVKFDGISSYIRVLGNAKFNLKLRDGFSVETWVNPDIDQKNKYPKIVSVKGAWQMHITKEPPFTLCVNLMIEEQMRQLAVANLQPSVWSQIVYTYNGSEAKIYINGKLAGQIACSGSIRTSSEAFSIGATPDGVGVYKGLIGEVCVYDKALGQKAVKRNFNAKYVNYISKKKQLKQELVEWNWNKKGNLAGWSPSNYKQIEVLDGFIHAVTKLDFWLISPVIKVNALKYKKIKFKVKSDTAGSGQIYFSKGGRFSAESFCKFEITKGGEYRVYEIDMSKHPSWNGIIRKLRFDVIDNSGANIWIDYFKFIDSKEESENTIPEISQKVSVNNNVLSFYKSAFSRIADIKITIVENKDTAIVKGATPNLLPGKNYKFILNYRSLFKQKGCEAFIKFTFNNVENKKLKEEFNFNLMHSEEGTVFQKKIKVPEDAAETFFEIGITGGNLVCEALEFKEMPSMGNWQAKWIWYPEGVEVDNINRYFRKKITVNKKIKNSWIQVTADNNYSLYINGNYVGKGTGWSYPEVYEITDKLRQGENIIAIKAHDYDGAQGLLLELTTEYDSGQKEILISDENWKCYDKKIPSWTELAFDDSEWKNAVSLGFVPTRPWKTVPYFNAKKKYIYTKKTPTLKDTLQKIGKEDSIRASIKKYQGIPSLFINGKLTSPMLGKDIHMEGKYVREYANSGIHLYIPFWPYVGLYEGNKYDYSEVDAVAYKTLSADPDARMIFVITINSISFWDKLNPEEVCTFADGTKAHQSFSSKKWRTEYGLALEKFIEHIEKSPYANRVFGYIVDATECEWQYWGSQERKFADYSQSMINGFRAWLRIKYNNDTALLRTSWGNSKINFDQVSIPTKIERLRNDFFVFRNPQKSKNVIDYLTFHSDVVADSITHFAKIVKQKTNNRVLCGTFYGYTMEHSGMGYKFLNGGHLALKKVLDSEYIDFLCSPVSYRMRKLGQSGAYMLPKDSVYLHGKMFFHEADMRTYLSDANAGQSRAKNLKDTVSVLKREYAKMLTDGIGLWWFDMRGGWFSNKGILDIFTQAQKISEDSLKKRNYIPSEIAVIVDEKSPLYMSLDSHNLNNELISMQREALFKMGAPFDTYLFSDVLDKNIPDYKLYIFLNTFYISEKDREVINRKFKKNGHVLLWVYAPGFINDDGFSIENTFKLTGIRLGYEKKEASLIINISKSMFNKEIKDIHYGAKNVVGPVFYINDPEATTLGILEYNNMPGLGIKKFKNWTSIYSAAPHIPSGLLKEFAKMAGVHIYSDSDDIIFVNNNYLAIHPLTSGEKLIRFPTTCSPYELFKRRYFAKDVEEFRLKCDKNSTLVFELR